MYPPMNNPFADAMAQDNDMVAELWKMVDTQQNMLAICDNKNKSQRETIASQQDMIESLQAQLDNKINLLGEIGAIRDVQEDNLDAKNEEVEALKAEIARIRSHQRTPVLEGSNGTSSRESDEAIYRKLCQIGETEAAKKLLDLARRLDQLMARDRAWMYQDHDHPGLPMEDNLLRDFVERATAAGIRVSRSTSR